MDTTAHAQTDGMSNRANSTDNHKAPTGLSANMSCPMELQKTHWTSLLSNWREGTSFAFQSTKTLLSLVVFGLNWQRNKHLKTHPPQTAIATSSFHWVSQDLSFICLNLHIFPYTTALPNQCWTPSAFQHIPPGVNPVTHIGAQVKRIRVHNRRAKYLTEEKEGKFEVKSLQDLLSDLLLTPKVNDFHLKF